MVNGPDATYWSGRPVVVTGGAGFLGRPLVRRLEELGAECRVVRSAEHNLRDAQATRAAVDAAKVVFHLAASVGGIGFNRRNPGPLARDNLLMATNAFEQSRLAGVDKLVVAGSVCSYPKHTPTPFKEEDLWYGYPEESNAPYGLAKKMALVLSDAYRRQWGFDSCVPIIANLYGPHDNFDLEDSHVIAAMVRKFVEAADRGDEKVVLWGTGRPSREFLYVEDAARALIMCAERLETSEPVNIGTGRETAIRELAQTVCELSGFPGAIEWDGSYPDGQPSRYLDVSRAHELLGFEAEVSLPEGLRTTIADFRSARVEAPTG